MAFPSVTYTFTNGTASDATQVNQNFADLINSLSDGTKSIAVAAIAASGAITATGGVAFNGGGTNLNHYEEGTFTATGTGFTTTIANTATYARVGKVVLLALPPIIGTSNSTTFQITGIPAAITPSTATSPTVGVMNVINNGNYYTGLMLINNDNTITVFYDLTLGDSTAPTPNFTSSGTKGITLRTIAYLLQ